jgi:hypothetical protein
MNDFKSTNKYAPEGVRYCNGYCQDFRQIEEFSGMKVKMMCKSCRNIIGLGEKQIKEGKITLEQFKENPHIVHGIDVDIDTMRLCNICKQNKPFSSFENTRNQCKACRAIESKKRNEDIVTFIKDIEKLKNNFNELEKFAKQIPKDKLIQIISHFKVGRKATDTKDRMVNNIVDHFKKIENTCLCRGGCGVVLQQQFATCEKCSSKESTVHKNHVKRMVEFEENLDQFVQNLREIKLEDNYMYNKKQILMIFHAIKAGVSGTLKKNELIVKINETLAKRREDQEKKIEELKRPQEIVELKLECILNGITVLAREGDGYINATQLCQAGGKLFASWKRLDSTLDLIKELEIDTGIPQNNLIYIKRGNSQKITQGSWIHPDLAVQLAQWISPKFALQVSRWVRELSSTGSIKLYQEKTQGEIECLRKTLIRTQNEKVLIEKKHKKISQRRKYHELKKGPCFYIISDGDSKDLKYKVGIDNEDINVRLKQYRTSIPATKLEFLVYTNSNKSTEDVILNRYMEKRKHYKNHEWIYDIEVSHIIESVKSLLNFGGINYTIDSDIQKYNDSCLFTEDEKQPIDTTEEERPVELEVTQSEDSESEHEQEEEISDISSLGIVKLKQIAKSIGIPGYTKYTSATKGELIKLINDRK